MLIEMIMGLNLAIQKNTKIFFLVSGPVVSPALLKLRSRDVTIIEPTDANTEYFKRLACRKQGLLVKIDASDIIRICILKRMLIRQKRRTSEVSRWAKGRKVSNYVKRQAQIQRLKFFHLGKTCLSIFQEH